MIYKKHQYVVQGYWLAHNSTNHQENTTRYIYIRFPTLLAIKISMWITCGFLGWIRSKNRTNFSKIKKVTQIIGKRERACVKSGNYSNIQPRNNRLCLGQCGNIKTMTKPKYRTMKKCDFEKLRRIEDENWKLGDATSRQTRRACASQEREEIVNFGCSRRDSRCEERWSFGDEYMIPGIEPRWAQTRILEAFALTTLPPMKVIQRLVQMSLLLNTSYLPFCVFVEVSHTRTHF